MSANAPMVGDDSANAELNLSPEDLAPGKGIDVGKLVSDFLGLGGKAFDALASLVTGSKPGKGSAKATVKVNVPVVQSTHYEGPGVSLHSTLNAGYSVVGGVVARVATVAEAADVAGPEDVGETAEVSEVM